MTRFISFMRGLGPAWKAVAVTLSALVFSHIAVYDLMSVSFFSPMEKAADFRFSDFYTLVADDRAVSRLDSDIVIVAVDGCRRDEIARALNDIDFCNPAAVGLDIAFSRPSDPDADPLVDALASCSNLVMPVEAAEDSDGHFAVRHISWYDSVVAPSGGFAAVNIQGDRHTLSTVRDFKGFFPVSASDTIESLPAALVGLVRPRSRHALAQRDCREEAISYVSREFETFYPDEILDNADAIEGRIVLVGKIHDAADLHQTPLDNFMPGLVIQAHTTATILSGDFTRRLSQFEIHILAAIMCFVIAWANLWLTRTPAGPLCVRLIQMLLLYLMILVGTHAYIRWNIDLNFAFAILATSISVAACDVFDGLFAQGALADKSVDIYRRLYNYFKPHEIETVPPAVVSDDDPGSATQP